jgi:potassium-transporting ATPase KdpC subunit
MSVLPATVRPAARQYLAAVRALLVLTVLLGLAYPLVLTGVGAVAFRHQADGSKLTLDGRTVGSSLLGQSFSDAQGNPLPQWFQPRPSAAGDGYDPTASSASNLGPSNPELVDEIRQRRAQVAAFNGVAPAAVPADAVTASGSGLDPDISPAYARLQVARVAKARHLPVARVENLVTTVEQGRTIGFLGEPRVNVVELNAALQRLAG